MEQVLKEALAISSSRHAARKDHGKAPPFQANHLRCTGCKKRLAAGKCQQQRCNRCCTFKKGCQVHPRGGKIVTTKKIEEHTADIDRKMGPTSTTLSTISTSTAVATVAPLVDKPSPEEEHQLTRMIRTLPSSSKVTDQRIGEEEDLGTAVPAGIDENSVVTTTTTTNQQRSSLSSDAAPCSFKQVNSCDVKQDPSQKLLLAGTRQLPAVNNFIHTQENTYRCSHCMGSGSFGEVWLCENVVSKEYCAIKFSTLSGAKGLQQIQIEGGTHKIISDSLQERKITPRLLDAGCGFIVTECVNGLPLNKLVEQVTLETAKWWTFQILVNFQTLMNLGWVHLDVKLDNLMLDLSTGIVYIIDWGKAKKISDLRLSPLSRERGPTVADRMSYWYSAPELCCDFPDWGAPREKVEVWSICCVVCAIFNDFDLEGQDEEIFFQLLSCLVPQCHLASCPHFEESNGAQLLMWDFQRPTGGCRCQAPEHSRRPA
eukprot:TRINITY_DN66690_c7_g1_i2.p1 TRINITY_DN66690_c7_g1~~TRINITY_DN66690_c7_g1_i2.p1  ORF type:complete len:485 (-),score=59.21 TRINITY_DN66690_c7_g1_i2:360-1814(-)